MTGTLYPGSIDGYAQLPLVTDGISPIRADDINRVRNAVVAVESELGVNPSGTFGTVKDRLDYYDSFVTMSPLTTKGDLYVHDGSTNERLPVGNDGYILSAASSETLGVQWIGPDTIQNVGVGGIGVYKQKTGSNFELRNIASADSLISVVLDSGNNEIDLSLALTNKGDLITRTASANTILPVGTNGYVLTADSGAAAGLSWVAPSGSGGANTELSNLTTVAVNTSLLPAVDDGYDLGSASQRWRDGYFGPSSLNLISTSSETGTARAWKMRIAEGAPQGRFNITEGSSEYLTISTAGNVGLGTATPTQKLHVVGSALVSSDLQVDGNTTLGNSNLDTITVNASSVALPNNLSFDSGTFYIDSVNNRIGVGITVPTEALHVAGNSKTTGDLSVDGNTTLGNSAADLLTITGTSVSVPNSLNFDSNTLYIDAVNNRIGIGNASPGSALHVTGSARITADIQIDGNTTLGDTSGDSVTINAGTVSIPNATSISLGGTLNLDSGTLTVDPTSNLVTVATLSVTGNTTLGDANTDQLTITGTNVVVPNSLNFDSNTLYIDSVNNRVGISTDAPTSNLHVAGDALITDNLQVNDNVTLGSNALDDLTINGYSVITPNGIAVGNALYPNTIVVTAGGDVGIRTASPTQNLTVNGNINVVGATTVSIGNSSTLLTSAGNTVLGTSISNTLTSNAGSWSFPNATTFSVTSSLNFDSGTLYLDSSSNEIGIGTTSPDSKLHVMVSDATASSNANAMATFEKNGTGYIQTLVPDANESGILFGLASNAADGGIIYNAGGLRGLRLRTGGNNTRVSITSDGYVGIGAITPAAHLDIVKTDAAAIPILSLSDGSNSKMVVPDNMRTPEAGSVLYSTDDSGTVQWDIPHSGARGSGIFDDFLDFYDDTVWSTTLIGSLSSVNTASSVVSASNPGVVALSTGTTSTGTAILHSSTAAMVVGTSANKIVFESAVRLEDLSNVTNEYEFYIGLGDNAAVYTHDNGAFFVYDRLSSTRWRVASADGGAVSYASSGVTVVADTWIYLRIELISTAASFYINGTLTNTVAINIPSGNFGPNAMIFKTAGTTSRTAYVDFINVYQKTARGVLS